jgi:hypothetical protein
MLLETPKTEGLPAGRIDVDPFDERNLAILRGLIANEEPPRTPPTRRAHRKKR